MASPPPVPRAGARVLDCTKIIRPGGRPFSVLKIEVVVPHNPTDGEIVEVIGDLQKIVGRKQGGVSGEKISQAILKTIVAGEGGVVDESKKPQGPGKKGKSESEVRVSGEKTQPTMVAGKQGGLSGEKSSQGILKTIVAGEGGVAAESKKCQGPRKKGGESEVRVSWEMKTQATMVAGEPGGDIQRVLEDVVCCDGDCMILGESKEDSGAESLDEGVLSKKSCRLNLGQERDIQGIFEDVVSGDNDCMILGESKQSGDDFLKFGHSKKKQGEDDGKSKMQGNAQSDLKNQATDGKFEKQKKQPFGDDAIIVRESKQKKRVGDGKGPASQPEKVKKYGVKAKGLESEAKTDEDIKMSEREQDDCWIIDESEYQGTGNKGKKGVAKKRTGGTAPASQREKVKKDGVKAKELESEVKTDEDIKMSEREQEDCWIIDESEYQGTGNKKGVDSEAKDDESKKSTGGTGHASQRERVKKDGVLKRGRSSGGKPASKSAKGCKVLEKRMMDHNEPDDDEELDPATLGYYYRRCTI